MKKQPTISKRVLVVLALVFSFCAGLYAQNNSVNDYTSIAKISGTADGKTIAYTNPYTNQSASNFAGTFKGTLNSNSEKFYCIDLQHNLEYNKDYWDESSTPSEITYILNNYFPYKTSYTGKLSDNSEAAAVQMAIWHFSDGVDANTISNDAAVKARVLAIIADAETNHANTTILQTLLIVPVSQSFLQGTVASFTVYAIDLNGNPLSNVSISLTSKLGTLSSSAVLTDSNGQAGPINLTYSGIGTATIKAQANAEIPQGTRYVHKTSSSTKQKLVLATPSFDLKEVSATVEWYSTSSDCDLKGFVTFTQGGWGSSSNSAPGKIRDTYFNNVFPSGLVIGENYKLTLTTASAVKDFLPAGGTAAAFTQDYSNVTSTSAGVLAGQLVALKMNVEYDKAGYIGTNAINLGDLEILSGTFAGYTVNEFLAFAEIAIGGGSLSGFTFSEFNDVATAINENFDNGTVDNDYLICASTSEKEADVKIEKSSSTLTPKCGEEFNYTITVTNNGPNEAKGIQAADVLPAGLNYVSSNASQGTYNAATGLWSVGDLANSASATLTITVIADCDQINNTTIDFGTAKDYNLFVILDATQPSSDTQGKVAVGRNASFGSYSIGDQLSSNSGDVLIVGNDLTFTSGAVYNGNVVYGDTTNLPISAVSIDGTLRRDNPINFATAKVYLENLSTTLSGYTVTGTTTKEWGGITLSGTDPYLNVFNVAGADLSSANNVSIEVPNGSVVLVNISGTTISWTGGLTVSGTTVNNVLYNFYEATQLTIQGIDVKGSILAPLAAVNFVSGVQNGQMMCSSLIGIGQFNNAPFCGNIPVAENIVNTASITSTTTIDTVTSNNSSSVEVVVNSTSSSTGGTGSTGSTGSTTGGSTWSEVCGFGAGEIVYTMAYSGSTIYAGTWGGKIYMSSDAGENWTVINSGMNVGFIWSLKISGSYIFAATEQGVYVYDGSNWTLTTLSGVDVHALATYNGTIYAGTWGLGVYKSTDNGTSWTQINKGLEYALAVQSLTINGSGEIYVGTAGGGIFRSIDGGENFTKLTCGYEIIWALGTTSNGNVYAGSYGDGLYRSTNGTTFEKLSLNVPYIYSIVVDANDKIYVSSWSSGVYESSDNGSTWTSLGLSGTGVSSLMVSGSSENVYVGTKEGKVYINKASESVTGVEANENIPTEFELSQNYPNPFNPTTKIQFALPESGNYSLRIYNVLGQEVARLVEGQLSAGVHEVDFNASRFASGMYIYKLTGNNVNLTKKMMLMK